MPSSQGGGQKRHLLRFLYTLIPFCFVYFSVFQLFSWHGSLSIAKYFATASAASNLDFPFFTWVSFG